MTAAQDDSGNSPGCTFIAEFACIHNGDADYSLELARAVRDVECDAVKLQFFMADEAVSSEHPEYAYYESVTFSSAQWQSIITACADMGLDVWVDVSGPFSLEWVRAAGDRVSGVKIHSADIDNPWLVSEVSNLGLPVAIGCGGSPLIDLLELPDRLGPTVPIILLHGFQVFP